MSNLHSECRWTCNTKLYWSLQLCCKLLYNWLSAIIPRCPLFFIPWVFSFDFGHTWGCFLPDGFSCWCSLLVAMPLLCSAVSVESISFHFSHTLLEEYRTNLVVFLPVLFREGLDKIPRKESYCSVYLSCDCQEWVPQRRHIQEGTMSPQCR